MPGSDVLAQAGLSQQEATAIRDRLTAEQTAAARNGGISDGGGPRKAMPEYDNGDLTTDQVKKLQEYFGITATGMWDNDSFKAAGDLTADEAWQLMEESQIAQAAAEYYQANPNVALDSMTLDYWLNANGYSGDRAQLFKAYMENYGAKYSRR